MLIAVKKNKFIVLLIIIVGTLSFPIVNCSATVETGWARIPLVKGYVKELLAQTKNTEKHMISYLHVRIRVLDQLSLASHGVA